MAKTIREAGGLLEAAASAATHTRRNIQIITPGWGSSGYYSPEVLQEAAANRVIPAGTQMYLNHPTATEKNERPERDVEKIAAVLVEDATWDGARLLAPADLIGPHAELVESLAPYIGVSIVADATDITIGEAEGRRGRIIEGLDQVFSVDFVTHAGRGGMVLMESDRPSLVNARAAAHGVAEATVNDTREALQNTLRDTYGGDKIYLWVRDFDDTTVWFEVEDPDGSGVYGQTYTDSDGIVALTGDRTEVRVRTEYVPAQSAEESARTATYAGVAAGIAAGLRSTTNVPATRSDSTTTTEADQEVTMGKIQVEESEHTRLVEQAGRVDTLEAERDTEKARADQAEQKLAEAAAAAAKGDPVPAPPAGPPTTPRQVIETRLAAQEDEIAQMRARERGRDIIAEELAEAWVAPSTVARLSSDLIARLPLVENKLDEAGLRTLCVEARGRAELEAAETLNAAGVGTPRGLGGMTTPAGDNTDRYTADIAEGMRGAFDLSESEAATAAKGR